MNDETPPGWEWAPLRDLLEHTIGGVWGKPIHEDEVNVRVLRVTEFGKHTVLEPETGVVRAISEKQLASRQLRLGDILLEKSGGGPNQPVGRVVAFRRHVAEPAVPTNFVQLLRPHREIIDPAFLTWVLDWWHKNGTTEAHQRATTNIRNLQTKAYLAHLVALPPLAEQERIVAAIEEHFSRLGFAEAALEVARAKLHALRRSVLAAAFSGRLTNPTHAADTDPGQLPGGWRWTALHDLLEHTIGGAWGKPIDQDDVNVRVLRVTEFGEHTVLEPETGVVRAVSEKQLASRQLRLGDILLEKSGGGPNQPVGRVVAFRTSLAEPAVPTNFVQLLRPSRDAIDPAFLTWTLDWWHKNGTAEMHQRATTNIRNLQTKAYLAQPVAVPPRAEQKQVVATIEKHFAVLNAAETALDAVRAKVSAFRRSLLAEAFAGRLVPQDSDDEPAASLLARITDERPARPTGRKRSK